MMKYQLLVDNFMDNRCIGSQLWFSKHYIININYLSIYIYIYIYMYVCMYVYIYVCVCVCIWVCVFICLCERERERERERELSISNFNMFITYHYFATVLCNQATSVLESCAQAMFIYMCTCVQHLEKIPRKSVSKQS